ncbi:MAG: efflux RND transporter periplasmic adaptor subunit [Acetobacteraceae bacterium]|nr:efflux RND transporter periplasmic adaptor subunit [Acetobacteraceae bacterium]
MDAAPMERAVPPPPGTAEAPPTGRRRRRLLWGGLGGAALVLAAAVAFRDQFLGEAPADRPQPAAGADEPLSQGEFRLSDSEMRALRIEAVGARRFRAERIAEGRIAVNEDRATPVFSPYNGRVVKVIARLGEGVQAGETLFEIETTDLAAAASDLLAAGDAVQKATTTLEQARREEARQASLFSARAAAQRDVEQARAAAATAAEDLRTAEATRAAARDKLRVLGRSPEQVQRIEQTRRVDAIVPVTAPISGTVTQRRVGPGQWLSAGSGDPVFTIADLSTVWLVAAVREMDAPLVRNGLPVEVTVGALPGRTFPARITTVGAGLDPITRRLTVRAEVEDPERLLKPEMFATFRIALGDDHQAVAVPVSAVIYRGPEASVWVALDGHRFILRRIRPGIRDGAMLEVTEGLNDGERIVTGGALFIDRAARMD